MSRTKGRKKTQVTTVSQVDKLYRVFIYDELNIHDIQREVWEEGKQGVVSVLEDFELRLDDDKLLFAEKKIGEEIGGKIYVLNQAQVEATDWFETENKKRIEILNDGQTVNVYVKGA